MKPKQQFVQYGKTRYGQEAHFNFNQLGGHGGKVGPNLTPEGTSERTDVWWNAKPRAQARSSHRSGGSFRGCLRFCAASASSDFIVAGNRAGGGAPAHKRINDTRRNA
jgi:hypothetical protein